MRANQKANACRPSLDRLSDADIAHIKEVVATSNDNGTFVAAKLHREIFDEAVGGSYQGFELPADVDTVKNAFDRAFKPDPDPKKRKSLPELYYRLLEAVYGIQRNDLPSQRTEEAGETGNAKSHNDTVTVTPTIPPPQAPCGDAPDTYATQIQAPAEEKIPENIQGIIDEAGKLVNEGRYADARQNLESARQLADSQKCPAALMEIRIDVAETHILEHSNLVETRGDLLICLRELPKDSQSKKRLEVITLLGDAESHLGNLEESKSLFREARQLAQQQQRRFSEARALIGLSHAEEFLGNLKEANILLDEATELYRAEYREANEKEKPRATMNLGACLSTKAMLVRREGRLSECIVHLTKAESLFREAKSSDNLGRTIMYKADVLFAEAKWQEGFDALREALCLFESIGNATWQCRCLDRMARLFFIHQNEKEGLACLGRALYLAGSGLPEVETVPYLLKFAHLCREHHENEKAVEFVGKAKAIAAQVQDEPLIAECLVAEARMVGTNDTKTREELFLSAVKQLETALAKCEVKGRRASYMHKIGDLHGWLGDLREAREWFERAYREYEAIGDVAGIGDCLASLAASAREEKSPDKAMATLERLLEFSKGKSLHHIRAGALHDLATLKLSQGNVAEAKIGFEDAKALAEKHNFKDVQEALKVSLRHLHQAERAQQPTQRDIPSLLRELHDWCLRYPKMRQAILPLWYHLHNAEIWSICRSMLGTKFLICTKDSAGFRIVAEALRLQGDLYCWGLNFIPKQKPELDIIPYPKGFIIPAGAMIAKITNNTDHPEPAAKALLKGVGENGYLFTLFKDTEERFPGAGFCVLGKRIRLAPMVYKMMLDTPVENLISDKRICLPICQSDDLNIVDVIRVACENGMVLMLQERLPYSDKIKIVCDNRLVLPSSNDPSSGVMKELWMNLLSSCHHDPLKALSEFSQKWTTSSAKGDDEKSVQLRIYLLRFQLGSKEVIHPAAVLLS